MPWFLIESILVRLGEQIRDARKAAGLTQDELARRADMTRQHLHRIELGATNPTVRSLYQLHRELAIAKLEIQWKD